MVDINIFLTGNIQVGKSTIINNFLEHHPELKVGGFRTITLFEEGKGVYRGVYIVPAMEKVHQYDEESHVGTRIKSLARNSFPERFDKRGVEILEETENYDIVLMDEVGFMETQATRFADAVMKILDSDTIVIGVVKPMDKGLPRKIKDHNNTILIEITEENRNKKNIEFEKTVKKVLKN